MLRSHGSIIYIKLHEDILMHLPPSVKNTRLIRFERSHKSSFETVIDDGEYRIFNFQELNSYVSCAVSMPNYYIQRTYLEFAISDEVGKELQSPCTLQTTNDHGLIGGDDRIEDEDFDHSFLDRFRDWAHVKLSVRRAPVFL